MRALDAYKRAAEQILMPLGAFVRLDRGDMLFASDAPARGAAREVYAALARAGFQTRVDGGVLRLTPEFERVPARLKNTYVSALKAGRARAERLTRAALARALREKDGEAAVFLEKLLEDIQYEGSANNMKLKWYGHACFMLTLSDQSAIMTDPFDASVGYACPRVHADIVTISHSHFDHCCLDNIIEPKHIVREAGAYVFGGARVTGMPSAHDDAGGAKRGDNIIFKIEAEGVTIVHLGDLGHIPSREQYAFIKNADVMLIPIGGYYTIDTRQALEIIEYAAPKLAIPMHFKTPAINFPIADEAEFKAALNADYARSSEISLAPPPRGAVILDYR